MATKVEMAFARLLRAFNKKKHVWKRNKDGKLISRPGTWTLDGTQSGWLVAEISNKVGGERNVFGHTRRKPAAFVRWVDDTLQALSVRRR